jgi:hypothetical protein
VLHEKIINIINEVIENPSRMPEFAMKGITYLIPKGAKTENPAKYRPITYLPTIYKIVTTCITAKITKYCEEKSIMTEQQKGCNPNSPASWLAR